MNNSSRVFTPAAQRAQAERGSAKAYAERIAEGFPDKITPELASFIAEQDTVFLATATADGAPYLQHRGGPKGFLQTLDRHTLAFADYTGNKQYISLGNLEEIVGRKAPLDTPYQAAVQARKDAEKAKEPLPPEPEKPVEDKPFVLDPLI